MGPPPPTSLAVSITDVGSWPLFTRPGQPGAWLPAPGALFILDDAQPLRAPSPKWTHGDQLPSSQETHVCPLPRGHWM